LILNTAFTARLGIFEEGIKMNDKVVQHMSICEELNKLYECKNHDYGDSFHQTFMEEGMAMARIRLGDKFNRFKTLTKGQSQQVMDESVRDTLLDLANYAIMIVMEMDISEEEVPHMEIYEELNKHYFRNCPGARVVTADECVSTTKKKKEGRRIQCGNVNCITKKE